MAERVYIALGSNLGDRFEMLSAALTRLDATPGVRVVDEGPVLETEALVPREDPTPQPNYLNTVVAVETTLTPRQLLDAVKAIEVALGRTDAKRWAPRLIDLDLVLWGDRVVKEPGLELPHPGLSSRRFVLLPLAALAPDARHPVLGKTASELLLSLGTVV